jgi:hypothetical protein
LLKFANLPLTTIEYQVDSDVWIPAEPASIEGSGVQYLFTPGSYRFGIDCADYGGRTPTEGEEISFSYECVTGTVGNLEVLECLTEVKTLLGGSSDVVATAKIVEQLDAVCTKLLEIASEKEVLQQQLVQQTELVTLTTLNNELLTKIADAVCEDPLVPLQSISYIENP